MSKTQPGTFEFVNRPYGSDGRRRPGVEATCAGCGKKEWKPAKSPGAGAPLFKAMGWELGRQGSHMDKCPECAKPRRMKILAAIPVSTKRLAGGVRKAGYMGGSVLDPGGIVNESAALERTVARIAPTAGINTALHDKLTSAIEQKAHPTEVWTDKLQYRGPDQRLYSIATTGFSRYDNARRAAVNWFSRCGNPSPAEGTDFLISPVEGGLYAWHPPDHLPCQKLGEDVVLGRQPARERPKAPKREPRIEEPKAKPAVTPTQTPEEPAPVATTDTPQPTRDQRNDIRDLLDRHYDMAKARYCKDFSDDKIAAQLDVPRVWVTNLRLDFYGDHDRNEAQDEQLRQVNEAIETAKAAYDRLLEMAGEADTIRANLEKLKARLA